MSLSAQQPFAEKWTAEAIFSVVVVYDVFAFKFGDCLFHGCRIEYLRRVKECAGEYLLATAFGDGAENARLLRGKLLDCKCEVVVFSGEDDCKSLLDVGFLSYRRRARIFCQISRVGTPNWANNPGKSEGSYT